MTELPEGWRRTTLGEECEIVSGSTPKTSEPAFWDGDIPWLTPADLSKWKGTYIDGGARYLTQAGLDSCSARLFPKNTVMMSSRAPIGYTAIANREMCTNQGFKSMLPSPSVHPEWLHYFLEHALSEIKAMASGTTFAEINGKKLGTLPMNLPPLEEQKRIVEVLDDHLSRLDKADQELNSAAKQCSMYRSSILNELLNPLDESHQGLPVQWAVEPLGEIADTQLGKMLNRSNQIGDSTIPYLRNRNVQWRRIDLSDVREMDIYPEEVSKFTAIPGDLLVCEGGESGRAAIWNGTEPIGIQNALHRVRPHSGLLTHYLLYYFEWQAKSRLLGHLFSGVTITHFAQEKLRKMLIQYPPINEQQRIVERLDSSLEVLVRTQRGIEEQRSTLVSLRRSLLNQAFTGTLRKGER
jgi:type I restriction enzyme S subunit